MNGFASSTPASGGLERGGAGRVGACTLLGPEGPDDSALGGGGDGFSQAFTDDEFWLVGCGGSGRLLRTT